MADDAGNADMIWGIDDGVGDSKVNVDVINLVEKEETMVMMMMMTIPLCYGQTVPHSFTGSRRDPV